MTDLKRLQAAMNDCDVPAIAAELGIVVGVCREDNPADVDEVYGKGTYARLFPPKTYQDENEAESEESADDRHDDPARKSVHGRPEDREGGSGAWNG